MNAVVGVEDGSCMDCDGPAAEDCAAATCASGYNTFMDGVGCSGVYVYCFFVALFSRGQSKCDSHTRTLFVANACDSDNVTNAVANADYSSCVDGDTTGSTCTPTCGSGFFATSVASGFALACDGNGDFDSANSSLVCTGTGTCTSHSGNRQRCPMKACRVFDRLAAASVLVMHTFCMMTPYI
jgi:hypothetical protein